MNFEYYYGTQADQFSFIRIPRILLLDKAFSALSLSAKVLYSVLLDRMGLSMKNKWLDEENKGHYPSRTTTSTPYPCRIFRLQSHSRFFIPPFVRHSWLGHPRLAMRLGKFGFSVSLSLRYHRFPYRLYGMIDNRQAHKAGLEIVIATGCLKST